MSAILGKATIQVDGKTLLTKHGAELDIGGDEREPVTGPGGVHGHTTQVKPPLLTMSVSKRGDVKVKDLDNIVNATILFEGDDGDGYVMSNAFRTKTVRVQEQGGTVPLEFSALRCDPM